MLFTTGQVAKLLGVRKETVHAWLKSGKVPFIKWGCKRLINAEDVEFLKKIVAGKNFVKARAK